MHTHKILNIASEDLPLQEELSCQLGISPILAQLLINRGVRDRAAAERFLDAGVSGLRDPFDFSGMPAALELIAAACRQKQKVMVFGDYDADGITSLALLKSVLRKQGLEVLHYLPHRIKEGYGLTDEIDQHAADAGVGLFITADCGISNAPQIARLRQRGIKTLITDHHEPGKAEMPRADAIINPKVPGSGYGFRELAGVGVVYKLCQGLAADTLLEELDIVALGTIADSVPLVDENRSIVKEGLKRLAATSRPGLRALVESAGIKKRVFDTTVVSFMLAPRINASGRMDTAESSLALLMAEDETAAQGYAQELERYNRQRQKVEAQILVEAQELIDRQVNFKEHTVIVVAKENWHHGVLGIVASKLADRFYRPAVVISLDEELCKGSARSIKNFHLFDALSECRGLLDEFGGHSHAAGLVIMRDSIDDFRRLLNTIARDTLTFEDLLPSLEVDSEVSLGQIDDRFIAETERLAPFGKGNPEPLLFTRGVSLKAEPRLLSRDTLKFWVTDGSHTFQAIAFGMGGFRESLMSAESFDIVYTPRFDSWGGMVSIVLEVKDIFFR